MNNNVYYTAPVAYTHINEIEERLEKAKTILNKYDSDNELWMMTLEDITELVYLLEISAYSTRKSVENGMTSDQNSNENLNEIDEILFQNIPTDVTFDGTKLTISSPLLLPNKRENRATNHDLMRSFVLANTVQAKLKKLSEDTQLHQKIQSLFHGKTAQVFITQYRDKKAKQCNQGIEFRQAAVDLDNLEASRLINTIFSFIGLSDNPWTLTDLHFACRLELDEHKRGTEIIVQPIPSPK